MEGANKQNKSLREAAGSPRDTSHRHKEAAGYSAKIATSNRAEQSANKTSNVNMDKKVSRPMQGSYEGLRSERTTLLQPNGRGYDNKALQKARYADKSVRAPSVGVGSTSLPKDKSYSIIDNYSSQTAKGSSSDRLNSIVEKNMMFK